MTRGRPFVQLKVAVAGDGLIAPGDGAPVWVTGPDVRAYAHLLRARADAVLVGRKTVDDDDPELTCRLPGLARTARRGGWILDPAFRIWHRRSRCSRTARRVPDPRLRRHGQRAARHPERRRHAAGARGPPMAVSTSMPCCARGRATA